MKKEINEIIELLRKIKKDHTVKTILRNFISHDMANDSRDKCFSLTIRLNVEKNETVAFDLVYEIMKCFENLKRMHGLFMTIEDYTHYHPRFQMLPERTDTGHGELTGNVKISAFNSWALEDSVIKKHAELNAALAAF